MFPGNSSIEIVNACDVIPYPKDGIQFQNFLNTTYKFLTHDGELIGRIIPFVIDKLNNSTNLEITKKCFITNKQSKTIQFLKGLNTFEKRNFELRKISQHLKKYDQFNELRGWRDEEYVCYYPNHIPYFKIERSMAPLLGIQMYGIHINGYTITNNEYSYWVAKRSSTKPTFPNMLDNTIAGGISFPYSVKETVFKESEEEAGLTIKEIEKNLKSTGVITYYYAKKFPMDGIYTVELDEDHLIQPECQFIYDLFLENIKPKINDNEVKGFKLMKIYEIKENLISKNFKPNCGLVILDWLIRIGLLDSDDPNFVEINQRSHRFLEYPTI